MKYININNIHPDDLVDYKKELEDELMLEYDMELIHELNYQEHQQLKETLKILMDY